jgi:putative two-component system response regulator
VKILVVDDDEITLDMLAMTLRLEGYDVLTARNGRDALATIKSEKIRMVISDWTMPEMDGIELCRRVRAESSQGYVYFILLTANSGAEETVAGFQAGADDYIVKPFNSTELLMRVKVGERIQALETRHVTIFALAKLAESRDPETGQHLERIREYCRVLAQHLAGREHGGNVIDCDFIEMIYLTSPLHDIGKVGIPDTVLLKPGRLSDREFEIMKTHVYIGANTLNAALEQYPQIEYLHMARDITLGHHEQYDGHGYPRKLAGDDIPLCARIVTLADVYDALTSKRVYKNAFNHEVTRGIIMQESGTHFDPEVVRAFEDNEKAFIEIGHSFMNYEMPEYALVSGEEAAAGR